jgi:hypothetical protein
MLEEHNKAMEITFKIRGHVINQVINLEVVITEFIAIHFCSDQAKQESFEKLFLWHNGMGLTRKKEILKFIVDNYEPDIIKGHPDTFKDLDEIIKCRNVLAHYYLDSAPGFLAKSSDGKFGFKGYKKPDDVSEYDLDKLERITDLANKYTTIFLHWR